MTEQVSVDVVAFENSTPLKPSPLASPAHLSNNNKSMNRINSFPFLKAKIAIKKILTCELLVLATDSGTLTGARFNPANW